MGGKGESWKQGKSIPVNSNGDSLIIPDGSVAVLHSRYGAEGVFSKVEIMVERVLTLRNSAAYKWEDLSVTTHEIDGA